MTMSSSKHAFTADGWIEAPALIGGEIRVWEMGEVASAPPTSRAAAQPVVSPTEAWEAAIEAARAEGWEEGHDSGLAEGRAAEEARSRSAFDAAARVVSEVEARMAHMEEAARRDVPGLATAIASHLVGEAVEGDPEILARLVRQAVSEFLPDEPVKIRVNPRDLALLSGPMGANTGENSPVAGRTVRWISDPEVRPGGCLVESRDRLVDGRVSTALERIYRALTEDDE
jgi:flagellar biosynthesis/type III secretory pathway protein FliH